MAAPKGNKNSKGNNGKGGRMKKGDEVFLIDLWNGDIKINDLDVLEDKETKKMIFTSGKSAFAWNVLKGNEKYVLKLVDKLYADRKVITGEGGGAIKLQWET